MRVPLYAPASIAARWPPVSGVTSRDSSRGPLRSPMFYPSELRARVVLNSAKASQVFSMLDRFLGTPHAHMNEGASQARHQTPTSAREVASHQQRTEKNESTLIRSCRRALPAVLAVGLLA